MIKKGIYKHYKGGKYEVIGTALHSETLEELIVYKSLYETDRFPKGTIWVRPKYMFMEKVQGKNRFEFISKI